MSTWIYVVELDSSSSTRSDIRIRSTSCPEFRFIILPIPCPSLDWALAILCPSYTFLQLLLRIHIRSQLHLGIKLPFSLSSRPLSLNIYLLTTFNLFHLLPPTHTDWLLSLHVCWSVSLSPWGHDCNTHRIPYYPYFCIPLSWLVSLSGYMVW